MSYLLAQILVCLLIAGLIGAIIGWLLRGGCSRKLRDCEDEWKMRVSSLENEYNSKVHNNNSESNTLYNNSSNDDLEHATLKRSTQKDTKDSISSTNIDRVKSTLSKRNIYLEDEKIALYHENGIDFENSKDLENDYDIQTIDGISENHAKALKGLGIHTTNNLVSKLRKDSNQITEVARELNVKPEDVSSWVSMAEIIKLPGVDSKTAKLMQNIGINSLSELSVTNPISLYNKMVVFNEKYKILQKEPPLSSIITWSKVAKQL
jgi:gas vesicle protein